VCFIVGADILEQGQPGLAAWAMQLLGEEGVLLCGQGPPKCQHSRQKHCYGDCVSGWSGFGTSGVVSSCWDVDDEARLLADEAMIVTLDFTVCPDCQGADNAPYLLADEAVRVTLDCTSCSDVGGRSLLLVNGARMVTWVADIVWGTSSW
jgi:hypothetical protein